MTTITNSNLKNNVGIGGQKSYFQWYWQGKEYQIVYETKGKGKAVLLLPAFSTVSSREEMRGIAEKLALQYQVIAIDWLGFGESDCPPVNYNRALFQHLLTDFATSVSNHPLIVIAAGHASGYALKLAQVKPDLVSQLILVAPTWKGPLLAMGLPEGMRNGVKNLVRSPVLGQMLYYLNTTPSFLKLMYQRHVYVDESKLTPEFIAHKQQITAKKGARYGPASFVTGAIDPVNNREEFLSLLSSLTLPTLIIVAENAPPQSQAEMLAMTTVSTVQHVQLTGTLGMSEEYPESVTTAIDNFLNQRN